MSPTAWWKPCVPSRDRQLVATSQEAVHCATSQPKLNSLEQSDREEAIECWLDLHKVADAWDLAPALVNARALIEWK
jgi:hypothetical protein